MIPHWFQADTPFPVEGAGGTGDTDEAAAYYVRPQPPSWSTADPVAFYQFRDFIHTNLNGAGWNVGADDVSRAVNRWASDFYRDNNRFPSGHDLLNDPTPWVIAQRQALRTDLLPATYQVQTPEGTVFYRNTVATGPMPVPVDPAELGIDPNLTYREQVFQLQQTAQQTGRPVSPDFTTEDGQAVASLQPADTIPALDAEYVTGILNTAALTATSGGGGRQVVYDKDQLAEAVRDRWRTILREEPGDAYRIAEEFIASANDFASQGGSRDFDTWILNRMRTTDRYQMLYAHKDESQSELDYLNSFVAQVGQFGLNPRIANSQVVRGLSTGAAPASFAESVGQSADVQAMGTGDMSRRFASLLQQLGPLQRA